MILTQTNHQTIVCCEQKSYKKEGQTHFPLHVVVTCAVSFVLTLEKPDHPARVASARSKMATTTFHAVMFPWFAMGHLTPFLHLSNRLAERGHRVSFLLPTGAQTKLQHFNLHPNLITFVPLVVPAVDGLPPGAETMSDIPVPLVHLLVVAMDLMRDQIETSLKTLKPDLIFFDVAQWIPTLARPFGIKSIYHGIMGAATIAHFLILASNFLEGSDLFSQPPGSPPLLPLHPYELSFFTESCEYVYKVMNISLEECDALSFRTCPEIEKPYCDYLESRYKKPVLQAGPALPPKAPISQLEERWAKWLGGFETGSVVYCALGSECVLKKEQFQELLLGLESTGLPFLAALKPPSGVETVEEVLPEGFEERVRGRGVVHGGWVQQTLILQHSSVGCFMSHCGFGSMWESLMNDCQIVLLPQRSDQFVSTRTLSSQLKVAVEVERREEDGWLTREGVSKAVKLVMDVNSKAGKEVRGNHAKWKEFLARPGLESSLMEGYVENLQKNLLFLE